MASLGGSKRKVTWGILGTAKIGMTKVIPAMMRGEFCQVEAIASRALDHARSAADSLGIPKAYGSYEALLADPDIEAVYIPLPNHLHVPWTIQALDAGKHVLCEKPIALSAAEAEGILAARKRSNKLVAEAFMIRHHPQWKKARDLVASGRIGQVRAIQTFFSYALTDPDNVRNKVDIGGGGLYDIGCYAVSSARFILGKEPERAVAAFDHDPVFGIDRLSSGLVAFPGGVHLTFTCSTQAVPYQRVQICGTTGRIEVLIPFNAPADEPCSLLIDDGSSLDGQGIVREAVPACDQYTLQGDAFSRAILGEDILAYPIEDAIANMRVIDALFRSGLSGRWESL